MRSIQLTLIVNSDSNPDYFEDNEPANFNKIAGIGFELWSMTDDILFDNVSTITLQLILSPLNEEY